MNIVFLLIFVFSTSFCMYYFVRRPQNKDIRVVYAGSPFGVSELTCKIAENPNMVYMLDDTETDVSKYEKMLIRGKSLEPEGIPDGSVVYVNKNVENDSIKNDTFVVLRIDNDRIRAEHPEKQVTGEGLKIRKVICVADVYNINDVTKKLCEELDTDSSVLFEETKIKLEFAKKYYKGEQLIISKTYKDDKLHISFHSLKNVYGVVDYINA